MTPAHYFDGRNGRLHPASLTVAEGHLHIAAPDIDRRVALDGVHVSEPFAKAPLVLRLDGGGTCEVVDGADQRQLIDALGYRKSRVVRWQERWPGALLALALLVAVLVVTYLRVVPAVAERIANGLPASVDKEIGQLALAGLEAQGTLAPSRLDDAQVAEVVALLAQARPAHARMPLRLLVRAAGKQDGNELGPNALALPDGTIVVTDEMIRLVLAGNDRLDAAARAQLLGVIGHEVGHVEGRHTIRTLTSSSLSSALSVVLFGDFSSVGVVLPTLLTQLQYSRDAELEADDYAVGVLHRNGMTADALVATLEALERQHPVEHHVPRWLSHSLSYLSTHPATAERIARLHAASHP
jgi:Zn-dependent protease with chaperone function